MVGRPRERDGLEHPPGWILRVCEHPWHFHEYCWGDGPGKQYLGCSVGVQGQAGDLGQPEVHMSHGPCRWAWKVNEPGRRSGLLSPLAVLWPRAAPLLT